MLMRMKEMLVWRDNLLQSLQFPLRCSSLPKFRLFGVCPCSLGRYFIDLCLSCLMRGRELLIVKENTGSTDKEKYSPETRDRKQQRKNHGGKTPKDKVSKSKTTPRKRISHSLVDGRNTDVDPTKIVGKMVRDYADDSDWSGESSHSITKLKVQENQGNVKLENSSDMEIENESKAETTNDGIEEMSNWSPVKLRKPEPHVKNMNVHPKPLTTLKVHKNQGNEKLKENSSDMEIENGFNAEITNDGKEEMSNWSPVKLRKPEPHEKNMNVHPKPLTKVKVHDNQGNVKLKENSSDMEIENGFNVETTNDGKEEMSNWSPVKLRKPEPYVKKHNVHPKPLTKLEVKENQGNVNLKEKSSDMEIENESNAETTNDGKEEMSIGGPVKLHKTEPYVKNLKVHPKPLTKLKVSENQGNENLKENSSDMEIENESIAEAANDRKEEMSIGLRKTEPHVKNMKINAEKNDPRGDSSASDRKVEEMETKIKNLEREMETKVKNLESELRKVEDMETKTKNLESELSEVAALEISLYSVVTEHVSSSQKMHTPARRLSRLYIYACKHLSQDKRATVAKNTMSGLVLVSKSCGNDVSRLTFWLSNTVVLREVLTKLLESCGGETNSPSSKWKNSVGSKQSNEQSFSQFVDDWQETKTYISALEKLESWLFSRIIESIWRQTLTPYMQSPVDSTSKKGAKNPALVLCEQGDLSIKHWKNAFHDALKRICPLRAEGHECSCLLVMARKVMDQCIGRLDVAMFNAILRESAHQIPTDPISDPIGDSKVLPISAGDLCFFSGAQLKNFVGNWTMWLSDYLDMDSYAEDKKQNDENEFIEEPKRFPLLTSLSDLLMLPKDMLIDRTIRMEVCPLISLPLIKRVLCNFSPDDFCPDPVPIAVLESLNAECTREQKVSGASYGGFPFPASPIVYTCPSYPHVAKTVTGAGIDSQFLKRSAAVLSKGYASDEELDELESCLGSIVEKRHPCPSGVVGGTREAKVVYNARFGLLREAWQAM